MLYRWTDSWPLFLTRDISILEYKAKRTVSVEMRTMTSMGNQRIAIWNAQHSSAKHAVVHMQIVSTVLVSEQKSFNEELNFWKVTEWNIDEMDRMKGSNQNELLQDNVEQSVFTHTRTRTRTYTRASLCNRFYYPGNSQTYKYASVVRWKSIRNEINFNTNTWICLKTLSAIAWIFKKI